MIPPVLQQFPSQHKQRKDTESLLLPCSNHQIEKAFDGNAIQLSLNLPQDF
jgi:hypothetical protein